MTDNNDYYKHQGPVERCMARVQDKTFLEEDVNALQLWLNRADSDKDRETQRSEALQGQISSLQDQLTAMEGRYDQASTKVQVCAA